MTRLLSMIVVLAAISVFAFGCATKSYVKEQTDPINDRMAKIEAMIKDCCGKADSATERAEEAAKRAERAANRAKKAFELEQKK